MKSLFAESKRPRKTSRRLTPSPTGPNQTSAKDAGAGAASQVKEQKAQPSPEVAPPVGPEHISFQRFFPKAKQVCVAGSFNGWQSSTAPMKSFGAGRWTLDLALKPGKYEYRFVVDGNWTDDPLAHTFVANPFGTRNCVLLVGAPTATENGNSRSKSEAGCATVPAQAKPTSAPPPGVADQKGSVK